MLDGRGFTVLVAVIGLAVGACSSASAPSVDPATSVTEGTTTSTAASVTTLVTTTTAGATTTAPATTTSPTTTAPATTTTTVYYAVADPLYGPGSLMSDGLMGSGCSPGAGPLPAGVWYGVVVQADVASLEFDLMCLYVGDLAVQIAADNGVEIDPEEDPVWFSVNENPTLRTVPTASGTVVHYIEPLSTDFSTMPYGDWLLGPPGSLDCSTGCQIYLYVNDGEATEIAEIYSP